ncbi:hypothetical protein PANDA_007255 [Ailuropoda melanoleuca]|uniref:Copine C-terminal domain-containing protein n=1 Tax=Ailuropoda melanoleuca TaxID=9646 RepID=D2HA49_AILME|nr:hypothetical protein PANDA_007255 [Ailuropoda melanoleuca]
MRHWLALGGGRSFTHLLPHLLHLRLQNLRAAALCPCECAFPGAVTVKCTGDNALCLFGSGDEDTMYCQGCCYQSVCPLGCAVEGNFSQKLPEDKDHCSSVFQAPAGFLKGLGRNTVFIPRLCDGHRQSNFTVAAKFTGSSGDPSSPESLIYLSPTGVNEYLTALWGVGSVIQDYDSDKLLPAFGFEAQVSHEFALIFNPSNPCCSGIQGTVDAYRQALPQVRLYAPTNSAPIINHVAVLAPQAAHQGSASQHLVLLLPPDGAVTGVEAARAAVVCPSHLRTSVILAGVGGAGLEAVEQLRADGGVWAHTP